MYDCMALQGFHNFQKLNPFFFFKEESYVQPAVQRQDKVQDCFLTTTKCFFVQPCHNVKQESEHKST